MIEILYFKNISLFLFLEGQQGVTGQKGEQVDG
jgi:hypothetical protein